MLQGQLQWLTKREIQFWFGLDHAFALLFRDEAMYGQFDSLTMDKWS